MITKVLKWGSDANRLFCVWQSGDAVEVCEQDTEADDRLQRGHNLFDTFFLQHGRHH